MGQVEWVRSSAMALKNRSKHSGSVPRRRKLSITEAITGSSEVPRANAAKNQARNASRRSVGVPWAGTDGWGVLSGSSTMSSASRHSA